MKRPTFLALRIALPLAGLLILGCDRTSVGPDSSGVPLRLEVTLSAPQGDPAHPVTIRAKVTSLSQRTVRYGEGCSGPGISMRLIDPDRRHVNYCGVCPNNPCPRCPDWLVPLRFYESRTREIGFAGGLRDCEGPFTGPSGRYRVEVRFGVVTEDGTPYVVSRTVEFNWTAAAPQAAN